MTEDDAWNELERKQNKRIKDDDDIQEYQKPWVSLTYEEMAEIWENRGWYVSMFKAVEAKLKEKNNG